MAQKYYITTAISYTSRKPHIGNMYEIVLTDAMARMKRMQGYDVFFLTGTDEHGQKIAEIANESGVSPKEYVDGITGQIQETDRILNISYDKFIRTTDEYHEKAVQKIFKKLYDQGDIYKSEYEGWYCVPDESFYTDSQLVDGKCPDCGREVVRTKEEAYFLKLTKYQKQLEEYIEAHPDFIVPESRKKEMLNNFIKPGLQDLCVSRSSFKWGVPVSFDEKHVVYVWIDALSNYITALGYDTETDSEAYRKYWPADIHVIGKDILRFHTIYWPIMLMALGEPLPKSIFGHPWMLFGEEKMSKSRGNVIYADDLCKKIGVDAVRYYMLSEMPYAQDGSITYDVVFERYNSDLANTLGNLVNRSVAMAQKYFGGSLSGTPAPEPLDQELSAAAKTAWEETIRQMESFHCADALDAVMTLARRANKYIDETAPWILAKDEAQKDRLATVLYNLAEAIRYLGVLLSPFLPDTAKEIFRQIGCSDKNLQTLSSLETFGALPPNTAVGQPVPLFARLDTEKMMAEILAEREAMKNAAEQAKQKPAAVPLKPEITIDDFAKTDLRVALVKSCEPVKKSDKLLCLQLDDGMGGRQIVSGIAQWYKPEELIGKKIILVANLKPAKLRGVESQGMLLAADAPDGSAKVVFPDQTLPCGATLH